MTEENRFCDPDEPLECCIDECKLDPPGEQTITAAQFEIPATDYEAIQCVCPNIQAMADIEILPCGFPPTVEVNFTCDPDTSPCPTFMFDLELGLPTQDCLGVQCDPPFVHENIVTDVDNYSDDMIHNGIQIEKTGFLFSGGCVVEEEPTYEVIDLDLHCEEIRENVVTRVEFYSDMMINNGLRVETTATTFEEDGCTTIDDPTSEIINLDLDCDPSLFAIDPVTNIQFFDDIADLIYVGIQVEKTHLLFDRGCVEEVDQTSEDIDLGCRTCFSGTFDVVTGVQCITNTLYVTTAEVTFFEGLLISVT